VCVCCVSTQFDFRLGRGAYKDVWLAYDTDTGQEVAWNTVDLRKMSEEDQKRVRKETDILKLLKSERIISFYDVWDNPAEQQICFTTEIVTSGTLKQYVNRVKNIKLKVIKKWCVQILEGISYLHAHDPPIIHRDLKCDNIFVNGNTADIRIGDFGLSAEQQELVRGR
jgi:WNK lysine deficient protein kinase